jgi:hypothetical protein
MLPVGPDCWLLIATAFSDHWIWIVQVTGVPVVIEQLMVAR